MSNRLVVQESKLSVSEVGQRLRTLLDDKGIRLFAFVDHHAAAVESGMGLGEEQVFVFGDPRVGTNLMKEDPSIGIELPLKILLWNDGDTEGGGSKIAYREPKTLLDEFKIVENRQIVEKMSTLMSNIVASIIA